MKWIYGSLIYIYIILPSSILGFLSPSEKYKKEKALLISQVQDKTQAIEGIEQGWQQINNQKLHLSESTQIYIANVEADVLKCLSKVKKTHTSLVYLVNTMSYANFQDIIPQIHALQTKQDHRFNQAYISTHDILEYIEKSTH